MALLDAGYWPTTYWALNYWNPDYWLHYGTYVPPPPVAQPTFGQPVPTPEFPIHLMKLIGDYLQSEVSD